MLPVSIVCVACVGKCLCVVIIILSLSICLCIIIAVSVSHVGRLV